MSRPRVPFPEQPIKELAPGSDGRGDATVRSMEPTAVILAADILRWVIPKVGRFPRAVRFGLGARLEGAHFDVLEQLVQERSPRT